MAAVRDLEKLEHLDLDRTLVGDAGLRDVGRLTNLRLLNLFETKVTAVGLRELKDLKKLETLYLARKQMTDEAVKALREMRLLHAWSEAKTVDGARPASDDDIAVLDLGSCPVTGAVVDELKHLKGLRELQLYGAKITAEGFKKLASLTNVNEVWIGRAAEDRGEIIERLWRARPEMRIVEDAKIRER